MKKNFYRLMFSATASALLISAAPTSAFAATSSPKSIADAIADDKKLSLDEAISIALENNSALKDLEESYGVIQDKRKILGYDLCKTEVDENFDTSFSASSVVIIDDDKYTKAETMLSYDKSIEKLPYQKAEITDAMEETIVNHFVNILTTKDSVEALLATYDAQIKDLEGAKKRFELGLMTAADYAKTERSVQSLASNIEALTNNLQISYNNLAKYLGETNFEQFDIDYAIDYIPLPENYDLQSLINERLNASPKLKQSEINLEELKTMRYIYSDKGGDKTELERKTDIAQAERSIADYKKSFKERMEKTYSEIKTLEKTITEDEISLAQAKRNYENATVQYNAGLLSENNYKLSAISVQTAENTLRSDKLNHMLKKISLEKAM